MGVKGDVIHRVVPNKDGLAKKQSFDEASLVLSEVILAKEECSVPLGPGFCSGYCDPIENDRSKCKACSYSNDEKKKLQDHKQPHYLRKCLKCHHFVRKGSFAYHKKQCEATSAPVKHHCGHSNVARVLDSSKQKMNCRNTSRRATRRRLVMPA